jgi:hypothetical protein
MTIFHAENQTVTDTTSVELAEIIPTTVLAYMRTDRGRFMTFLIGGDGLS